MTVNILVFVFVGLFILFLVESIYFLKKKLNTGIVETHTGETGQSGGRIVLIGGLIIAVLAVASLGWLFLTKQKTSTSNTTVDNILPTEVPTQPPTPTLVEIVYTYPTVTSTPISPTPTVGTRITPTKTPIPTKTPTPTKPPSPTPTKKVTATPTPSKTLPIGGPQLTSTISPTPTNAVVIVPKTPIAGSIEQTLVMFFLGISTVVVGLIL